MSYTSRGFAPGIYLALVLGFPSPPGKTAPELQETRLPTRTAAIAKRKSPEYDASKNGPLDEGPLHVEAAVDTPHLPGDIGGSVGSEEVYDPGDLLRPAQTAHRNL